MEEFSKATTMMAGPTNLIALFAILALTPLPVACGGGLSPEEATTPASSSAAAAVLSPTVLSGVLAVEQHKVEGVAVELTEVARARGDTLNVRWRYTNTSQDDKVLATGLGWYTPYKLAADTYLIDPVNQKKYLVITDSERQPVASRYGNDYEAVIRAGQTINTWAKFPAPATDVEMISIYIPGTMPFEGVPINR